MENDLINELKFLGGTGVAVIKSIPGITFIILIIAFLLLLWVIWRGDKMTAQQDRIINLVILGLIAIAAGSSIWLAYKKPM